MSVLRAAGTARRERGRAGARRLVGVSARETMDVSANARMLRAARGGHDTSQSNHRDIMSLAGLLSILNDDSLLQDILARPDGAGPDQDLVAPPPLRPVIAAALAGGNGTGQAEGFVLAVTATAAEADDLAAGLASFLPSDSIATFPGWETL